MRKFMTCAVVALSCLGLFIGPALADDTKITSNPARSFPVPRVSPQLTISGIFSCPRDPQQQSHGRERLWS
jgi:hypothetical protein